MKIPGPLLRFFGYLYNFNTESYRKAAKLVMSEDLSPSEESHGSGDTDYDDDDGDDKEICDEQCNGDLSVQRCRKMQSLFQILYYVNHCGRKRTPMHIMNAESVHSLRRGGKVVTKTLSHQGLALSYTGLRRYQHDLASFTALHSQDRVELPGHFDPGQFTSGVIDNWDQEGENVSEHNTVTVVYQDKP